MLCIGIDPGSSKAWATWEIENDGKPASKNYQFTDNKNSKDQTVEQLIDRITKFTDKGIVVLAIDAPICVPSGTDDDPMTADQFGWKEKQEWPFNVNHFSTRPCERALSSRIPETGDGLANAIRDLSMHGHSGVSVMGYQRTPHGPVVRAFVKKLKSKLEGDICFDPEKAYTEKGRKEYNLFILESHPAVSLALWKHESRENLRKYKGSGREESCNELRKILPEEYSAREIRENDDDILDALVSVINAHQLVNGRGDWFGTYETGYFLIPHIRGKAKFSELWKKAWGKNQRLE
jgi:predicted RNase H-like nuclease